jgi:hypothetical protein
MQDASQATGTGLLQQQLGVWQHLLLTHHYHHHQQQQLQQQQQENARSSASVSSSFISNGGGGANDRDSIRLPRGMADVGRGVGGVHTGQDGHNHYHRLLEPIPITNLGKQQIDIVGRGGTDSAFRNDILEASGEHGGFGPESVISTRRSTSS